MMQKTAMMRFYEESWVTTYKIIENTVAKQGLA
jgi:hypothetical protein